jgi:enamine deaminase RidA (YjgF/YER057c/UK114 family)
MITRHNPTQLHNPPGYHHVTVVESGRLAFLAGQCPLDAFGALVGAGDIDLQFDQVAANAAAVLAAVGARPDQVVRSVVYVVSDDNSVLAAAWHQTHPFGHRIGVHHCEHAPGRDPTRILRPARRSRPHCRTLTTRPLVRSCVFLPNIGAYMFGEDELGDILEGQGFASVRTKNFGPIKGCGANAPMGEMTREELAAMTDQELLAYEREHHRDPYMTLVKA